MCNIPRDIINLAFNLAEGDVLSTEQQTACDEWNTGVGLESMKIAFTDLNLLKYVGFYNKCLERTNDICNDLY